MQAEDFSDERWRSVVSWAIAMADSAIVIDVVVIAAEIVFVAAAQQLVPRTP